MTSKTPRSHGGSAEDARLDDLLRADAAAIIDDDLDDEAPDRQETLPADDTRLTVAQHARSQVYSIRVPVERLEQVRRLANERGIPPTAMLRQWVLMQLDAELGAEIPAAGSQMAKAPKAKAPGHGSSKQRRDTETARLETATAALMDVSAHLAKTLTLLAELFTTRSAAIAQPTANIRALPPHPGLPADAALHGAVQSWVPNSIYAAGAFGLPVLTDASMQLTVSYLNKGLAELRSTVEGSSKWPGFGGHDLDSLFDDLYGATDEELSSP